MTEIIIKPQRYIGFNFKELYEYKDTLLFLAWKDIKIKYKQAVLGFIWVILQPLLTTLVFVILNKTTNLNFNNSDVPYVLFVLSGIILWNLFASSINQISQSVVNNAHILKKIYFPRIFFPLSSLLANTFDFIIASLLFLFVMLYYHAYPSITFFIIFPIVYIMVSMLIIGLGSFFAALNVKYRDIRYVVPFITQLMFFVSPVFYSVNLINVEWVKNLYYFNPLTGIIELFRYSLFNTPIDYVGLIYSIVICILFFVFGLSYFRVVEQNFADIA